MCELIIAAQLVFSGWSSRILLRLSPGWDHRAGIVLSCGEPAEMGECPSISSSFFPLYIFLYLSICLLFFSLQLCSEHFHHWWVFLSFSCVFHPLTLSDPPSYHSPTCFPPPLLPSSFHPASISPHPFSQH